jgi:hypothetical protein
MEKIRRTELIEVETEVVCLAGLNFSNTWNEVGSEKFYLIYQINVSFNCPGFA